MQPNVAEPAARKAPAPLGVAIPGSETQPHSGPIARLAGRLVELLVAHQTLVKYAITGASGYVVYLGILAVMYDLAVVPFLPAKQEAVDLVLFTHGDARLLITTLVATQASIFAVFAGHCRWTFVERSVDGKSLWLRFAQFEARALVSTLGILTITVNAAVLSGVNHFLAVPMGLVATFAWNWLWDSKLIWRKDG
ncbi:MAG: GtrA family protein [Dehalococcoidia bacterium]